MYVRIQNANLSTTYSRYSIYVLTILINEIPLHFRIIRINKAAQELAFLWNVHVIF